MDRILLQLAFSTLRIQNYRHGAFLEAAASAAKCAIYATYLEQDQNLRATSQLHHIEAKRVRVIVEEVRQCLTEGKLLKMLGSQEPLYLIQLPFIWLEYYPWKPGQKRVRGTVLTSTEQAQLEPHLSDTMPAAQIINTVHFQDLIMQLYERSQADLPPDRVLPLSEAMLEHIERCLLHSGTVTKVITIAGMSYYSLTRESYSPVQQEERLGTMMADTARYFELMQRWVDRQPHYLRVMEELDIAPDQIDAAIAELDQLVHAWANRHHQVNGVPFGVQMACGVAQAAAPTPSANSAPPQSDSPTSQGQRV
jgi:hypothetical protein